MTETIRQQILVVEDDPGVARLIRQQLEMAGFAVHIEDHGANALSYAVEHRPQLVILDLRLPDIDGYEVCRQLRKLHTRWEMPILMLTGMDHPVDQLRGFAHGADAYLTKPYDRREFLQAMTLLLGNAALT